LPRAVSGTARMERHLWLGHMMRMVLTGFIAEFPYHGRLQIVAHPRASADNGRWFRRGHLLADWQWGVGGERLGRIGVELLLGV
jgi:hypothetical protein